jgi:hypothetical protein
MIIISHFTFIIYRSFRRRQKLREETIEKQIPGIHLNVCPFCQCAGCEAPSVDNDDDSRSVAEGDDGFELESLE